MIKKCNICGADYITDSNSAKYCPGCRAEGNKRTNKIRQEKLKAEYAMTYGKFRTAKWMEETGIGRVIL